MSRLYPDEKQEQTLLATSIVLAPYFSPATGHMLPQFFFNDSAAYKTSRHPASSKSINGDSLFDLPESNFSPQFCSFANNTHMTSPSPVIPCGDTIVDKKQDTPQQEQNHQHEDSQHHQQILFSRDVDTSNSRNNADTAPSNDNASLDADIKSIIAPNKYRELVTGFTYAVMCQFVRAKLTQADQKKKGSRTKTPLGHGGLKCKYCEGIGGQTGRYFPSSLKTFSDPQKTLLPMHRHLNSCTECPGEVKLLISSLHDHHEEVLRVKRRRHGGQISFYRLIWNYIHADDSSKKQHHQRSSRLKM
jgi:hypothetical protein